MTDNHSDQQTEIHAENIGIVGDHAHIEGGIHFHRQVTIYDGVKPVSAGDLLDACQAQVASILYDARRKYDADLYVNRAIERDLCTFFDTPLNGPAPNCFLIVAPAGSGKTNLLCDLARVRSSHQPVLLLMGGKTGCAPARPAGCRLRVGYLGGARAYPPPNDLVDHGAWRCIQYPVRLSCRQADLMCLLHPQGSRLFERQYGFAQA